MKPGFTYCRIMGRGKHGEGEGQLKHNGDNVMAWGASGTELQVFNDDVTAVHSWSVQGFTLMRNSSTAKSATCSHPNKVSFFFKSFKVESLHFSQFLILWFQTHCSDIRRQNNQKGCHCSINYGRNCTYHITYVFCKIRYFVLQNKQNWQLQV